MRELRKFDEVEQMSDGDARPVWAAQAREDGSLGDGVRAWAHGGAVAVASPKLSRHDRLAVHGPVEDAAPLLAHVVERVGTWYRVFGAVELIEQLVSCVDRLRGTHRFCWMDTESRPPQADGGTRWLDGGDLDAVTALFGRFYPDSYAQPGRAGVRRWAGVGDGPLAVAADAWSARGCGLLAGVVTHPQARGRGLARRVCGFVLDALVVEHGRAALMAHHDNAPAIAVYQSLGMTKRIVGSAAITG